MSVDWKVVALTELDIALQTIFVNFVGRIGLRVTVVRLQVEQQAGWLEAPTMVSQEIKMKHNANEIIAPI
jgi:hypothetical protein